MRPDRRAFTLVEVLIAMTLLGVVMVSVGTTVISLNRSISTYRTALDRQNALQTAETALSTLVRFAGANPYLITASPTPGIEVGGAGQPAGSVRLRADFNPPDGDVADQLEDVRIHVASDTLWARWTSTGSAVPLATPIRTITWQFRNASNAIITDAALVNAQARQVQITMQGPPLSTGGLVPARTLIIHLRSR
jgi:prepilin-type N-terminal cleavage/methylation domain-containing protein